LQNSRCAYSLPSEAGKKQKYSSQILKQRGKIEISLVMKGTTQYCLEDQIFRMFALTQLRIFSFPFSIKKHKD
jgi:c-di-GMP-binding flagellar brake protein YcgR